MKTKGIRPFFNLLKMFILILFTEHLSGARHMVCAEVTAVNKALNLLS